MFFEERTLVIKTDISLELTKNSDVPGCFGAARVVLSWLKVNTNWGNDQWYKMQVDNYCKFVFN